MKLTANKDEFILEMLTFQSNHNCGNFTSYGLEALYDLLLGIDENMECSPRYLSCEYQEIGDMELKIYNYKDISIEATFKMQKETRHIILR